MVLYSRYAVTPSGPVVIRGWQVRLVRAPADCLQVRAAQPVALCGLSHV